jgi:hypothetical protein
MVYSNCTTAWYSKPNPNYKILHNMSLKVQQCFWRVFLYLFHSLYITIVQHVFSGLISWCCLVHEQKLYSKRRKYKWYELTYCQETGYNIINELTTAVQITGRSKSHANHIKIFIDGCNSIQFNWINKHISLWLYKSPRRSRHVVTCLRQSVSCLQSVKVQRFLFHKCNKCSLLNITWHLLLT